jgi:hypothetical protein
MRLKPRIRRIQEFSALLNHAYAQGRADILAAWPQEAPRLFGFDLEYARRSSVQMEAFIAPP